VLFTTYRCPSHYRSTSGRFLPPLRMNTAILASLVLTTILAPLRVLGGECRQGAASATQHCTLPATWRAHEQSLTEVLMHDESKILPHVQVPFPVSSETFKVRKFHHKNRASWLSSMEGFHNLRKIARE
jgi:hypothetical protein